MKALVISDSHGNPSAVSRAILKEKADCIIHLGDGCHDIPDGLDIPCYQVCGNCDSILCRLPEKLVIELEGVRLLLAHGHKYNVKNSLSPIYLSALEEGALLALFGHTHIPFSDIDDDKPSLFNPGSINRPPHSYGTIVLRDGKFSCRLRTLL